MNISKNFTLSEMTATSTGIENSPNAQQLNSLINLVEKILQPVRDLYGKPITVTSGFRNEEVNRAVGGAKTSQHMRGEAADIKCSDNAAIFKLIKDNFLFDQLIWEKGNDKQPAWVHVSLKKFGNRKQVLYLK